MKTEEAVRRAKEVFESEQGRVWYEGGDLVVEAEGAQVMLVSEADTLPAGLEGSSVLLDTFSHVEVICFETGEVGEVPTDGTVDIAIERPPQGAS
jgi:hypothetical protein